MRCLILLPVVILLLTGCRTQSPPAAPTLPPPIQGQYLKGYQAAYRTPGARLYRNGYHYLIERLPDHTYQYQQFHPEKAQLTLRCTYADATLQQLTGTYESWWDNGLPKATGQYRQGQPDGEWRFYEPQSGQLYAIGHYRLGAPEGKWQFIDPVSTQPILGLHLANGLRNGPFSLHDSTGQVAAQGHYFLDALDTLAWRSASPDTLLAQRLDFDFRRMQGQRLTVAPAPVHCAPYRDNDRFECTRDALNRWIDRQLQIPALLRQERLEGEVTLAFYVDAQGSLMQIEAISGLCAPLQQAIQTAFHGFPAQWDAAQWHGEPRAAVFYHSFHIDQRPAVAPPAPQWGPDLFKRLR